MNIHVPVVTLQLSVYNELQRKLNKGQTISYVHTALFMYHSTITAGNIEFIYHPTLKYPSVVPKVRQSMFSPDMWHLKFVNGFDGIISQM